MKIYSIGFGVTALLAQTQQKLLSHIAHAWAASLVLTSSKCDSLRTRLAVLQTQFSQVKPFNAHFCPESSYRLGDDSSHEAACRVKAFARTTNHLIRNSGSNM